MRQNNTGNGAINWVRIYIKYS